MKRGPKPPSLKLKSPPVTGIQIVDVNPPKRKPRGSSSLLAVPDVLESEHAISLWKQLAPKLAEKGILNPISKSAVTRYVYLTDKLAELMLEPDFTESVQRKVSSVSTQLYRLESSLKLTRAPEEKEEAPTPSADEDDLLSMLA